MNKTVLDLWVGFFVAIGLVAMGFLALKVGNLSAMESGETYLLQAKFDNIGALKVRAPVKSAGVVVGRVSEIKFDAENYVAVVSLQMDKRYQFPRDTFATINTQGLLGEQYVGFDVGGDPEVMKPGEMIRKTQSAVVLEKLISQFLFNKASEGPANP
ncbi:outer membrane lipid asymmetry maintenance protein MlaD [Denitratisoma oestradiolicum]|uniref:Toluene transporter subunit: membrane component of ABC superfamily n=1 Tax=Denitratisoma oestradiolicum TaxID=311182 RepID=A0A6S6XPF9_9PROT|nr:outer membrane lipid asymmetry maintenance protein MlaD [Denitratisoma oestradiolicum]TWO81167.1 outer membrane lipid asymmetry maintenance protein MlaD [Denitratisoma oestradiolicum]CAB1367861.1 toluene transporter subunit: membrane component of ABC superfamily [Denitratisoma oestradiolicum]